MPEQEAPKSHHREAPLGKEDATPTTAIPVPSSDEEPNGFPMILLPPQADSSQPSSGYASQVPSQVPSRRNSPTPPREQDTQPDGTSQHGDATLPTPIVPASTQTVKSSQQLVIGTKTPLSQLYYK